MLQTGALAAILTALVRLWESVKPLFGVMVSFFFGEIMQELKMTSDFYEKRAEAARNALKVQQDATSRPVAGAADRLRKSAYNRDRVL